jgi:hypothetical protein
MTVAMMSLIARKKRASADAKAYLATTNPELQITIKIQGATTIALFIGLVL